MSSLKSTIHYYNNVDCIQAKITIDTKYQIVTSDACSLCKQMKLHILLDFICYKHTLSTGYPQALLRALFTHLFYCYFSFSYPILSGGNCRHIRNISYCKNAKVALVVSQCPFVHSMYLVYNLRGGEYNARIHNSDDNSWSRSRCSSGLLHA